MKTWGRYALMECYVDVLKRDCTLNDILANALENLSGCGCETLSLIFEDDHFHMILEGIREAQQGKVVSLKEAFSDLD
jgi:hypothetical protein